LNHYRSVLAQHHLNISEKRKNIMFKTIISIFALTMAYVLLSYSLVFSASLVFNENFEDGNASDTFGSSYASYWQTHINCTEVVTNTPHSGNYSFRGSLSESGSIDNISNEPGCVNAHNSFGQGPASYGNTSNFNVGTIDSGEFYLSWWVKFDSGELANLLSDTHKMLYLYTNGSANNLIMSVSDSRQLRLFVNADNQAGYPYTAGDNPDNNYQYGYNLGVVPSLDDGNWHKFEFYAKWGTGGGSNSAIKVAVDDTNVLDVNNAVAIYQTGDHVWTAALPSNLSAAGTAVSSVGWQVDDIEIWDGLPDTTTPPPVAIIAPPSNLRILTN
jgi:hypothetical protein